MLNADGTMWNSHAEHDAVLPRWHGSGSRNFSEIESAAGAILDVPQHFSPGGHFGFAAGAAGPRDNKVNERILPNLT